MVGKRSGDAPMNEAKLMYCLDREDTFRNIKSCDILGESIVLDEHSHQITTREKLHDEVQIRRILEGVE